MCRDATTDSMRTTLKQRHNAHPEEDVCDLLDLLLCELPEHNDFVQAIEELWPEVALELLVHQGLDAIVAHVLWGDGEEGRAG